MAANVRNYISAGNAAVNKAVQARRALAENKARMDEIGMEAVAQDAKTRVNTAANNALTAKQSMLARTNEKLADIKIETDKAIAKSKRGARKAGMLAGGVAMLGVGAMQMNKKEEPNEMLAMIKKMEELYTKRETDARSKVTEIESETYPGSKLTDTDKPSTETAPVQQGQTPSVSTLTGKARTLADAIAGPESGQWGYNAFNQGGAAGGTKVLGKYGSYKDIFNQDLTKLTVQQVMDLQSDDGSMSDEQWQKSGKIHAAGRYQFIGPTLREEVSRMGLDTSRLFDQTTQDEIFLSHIKRVGNISPWVGPSTKYSPEKVSYLNSLVGQI